MCSSTVAHYLASLHTCTCKYTPAQSLWKLTWNIVCWCPQRQADLVHLEDKTSSKHEPHPNWMNRLSLVYCKACVCVCVCVCLCVLCVSKRERERAYSMRETVRKYHRSLQCIINRMFSPVQWEGLDGILPNTARLRLHPWSHIRLQCPVLTLNGAHLCTCLCKCKWSLTAQHEWKQGNEVNKWMRRYM